MNYYPEQLEQVARYCRALNGIDSQPMDGMTVQLRNRIAVEDEHGTLLGHLVDEIGGAWSFEPVAEASA